MISRMHSDRVCGYAAKFSSARTLRQQRLDEEDRQDDQDDERPDVGADAPVYEERRRVCDLGVLRVPFKTKDGNIGYRCPAEPERAYTAVKAGRPANMEGRICLCNGLLATAGLAQVRPSGYVEPPVVTGGSDYRAVEHLVAAKAPGEDFYTAADVIDYLL